MEVSSIGVGVFLYGLGVYFLIGYNGDILKFCNSKLLFRFCFDVLLFSWEQYRYNDWIHI